MKVFFMIVYIQALRLVPSAYFSLLEKAFKIVSCSKSFASSISLVSRIANGLSDPDSLSIVYPNWQRVYIFGNGDSAGIGPDPFVRDIVNTAIHTWSVTEAKAHA